MNRYLVTTLFHDKDKSYEVFHKRIKTYRAHAKLFETSWLISTEDDRDDVYHYLREAIDADDDLVIFELGEEAGYVAWADAKVTDQLQKVFV